MTEYLGKCCKR